METQKHKQKATKSKKVSDVDEPIPLITKPFSLHWMISSVTVVLFFFISIGALAGFFEIMERKYPTHFRYHSTSQSRLDPKYTYIPQQYQRAFMEETNESGFACREPQNVSKNIFTNLFDLSDVLDPNTRQIVITIP